jgi:hypothetical protein
VWVPDAPHEALRELVRARLAVARDQMRARDRLGRFLLHHGVEYEASGLGQAAKLRASRAAGDPGRLPIRSEARS